MMLICPVCASLLKETEHTFLCGKGHCFDKARHGYVNLLLGRHGGRHGDDARMLAARSAFLDKGYYASLAQAVNEAVLRDCPGEVCLADCGCGEGYYTGRVLDALSGAGHGVRAVGIDISRDALSAFSRRRRDVLLAVASVQDLPLADGSCDVVMNLFAPENWREFYRVLRRDGRVVKVIPLEKHLLQVKQAVYPEAYENRVSVPAPEGFSLQEKRELKYDFRPESREDLQNLFCMTPYYYKTGREDQERLLAAAVPEITAEFCVLVYRKEEE